MPHGGGRVGTEAFPDLVAVHSTGRAEFAIVEVPSTPLLLRPWPDPVHRSIWTELRGSRQCVPVLDAITGLNWRIVRSGKWFRAIMSFDARTPIRVEQIFHISAFKGEKVDFNVQIGRPLRSLVAYDGR